MRLAGDPFTAPMAEPPIAVRWAARPFAVLEGPPPFVGHMGARPLADPMAGLRTARLTLITMEALTIAGVRITAARPSSHRELARASRQA